MRYFLTLALLLTFLATAQSTPPQPIFFDEAVMSEQRARELIDLVRENFWGSTLAFDGRTVIEPRDDEERRSIPIPEIDALWLVEAGSIAGEATRCGVDGLTFQKSFFKPFWGRYREEKQIAFAMILIGAANHDVVKRRGSLECTAERRKVMEQVMAFLASRN